MGIMNVLSDPIQNRMPIKRILISIFPKPSLALLSSELVSPIYQSKGACSATSLRCSKVELAEGLAPESGWALNGARGIFHKFLPTPGALHVVSQLSGSDLSAVYLTVLSPMFSPHWRINNNVLSEKLLKKNNLMKISCTFSWHLSHF